MLRVFEPGVFQKLSDMKLDLTSLRDRASDSHDENQRQRRLVESIPEGASQPGQAREIVKQLFPTVEWVFGGPTYGHDFEESCFRDLRLCHPDVFDRYFHLTIPEGDISQAQLDHILSLVADRSNLAMELRALNQRGLLGVALDRLEAYKEKIDVSHAIPFVTALFDIGDELPEEQAGFFSISPEMHASRIIYWFLKQESDVGKRGQILKEAMKASTGLYLPVRTASLEGNQVKREKDPGAFSVTDADLKELQQICVEKIEQAASSEKLATHPKILSILYRWRVWGSQDKPRQWVETIIESPGGLLAFLTACLQRSMSQGVGDYMPREHWRINLKNLEDFVSIENLEERVGRFSLDCLGEKEQKAVKAFHKALKRMREGKSDDDWQDDEDA